MAAEIQVQERTEADGSDERARLITTRRRLPSGRSVLGALLVTVAAFGTYLVASTDGASPQTSYVVVARPLEAGDVVSPHDVEVVPMTLSPQLASTVLTSTDGLDGAVALRPLRAGELVVPADLRPAQRVDGPPLAAVHELTLPVPGDRAPAHLQRGDRVTLVAHDDRLATSTVAAEDAVVLAFEPADDGFSGGRDSRLTLALDDAETVLRVSHLSFSDLTVVLTTRAMADDYPASFTSGREVGP